MSNHITVSKGHEHDGSPVWRARNEAGDLIAAWGPDPLDENGHPVKLSDEHWIGTLWNGDDYPHATVTGPRAEVEEQARKWSR